MRHGQIEALLLFTVGVAAAWDGVRTATQNRDTRWATEAGGYVTLLGLLLAGLAVAYWFWTLRTPRETGGGIAPTAGGRTRWALLAFALLAGYALLTGYAGYLLSTAIFLVAYLRVFGGYRWVPTVISSLAVAAGLAYLWTAIGIVLPHGVIPWP